MNVQQRRQRRQRIAHGAQRLRRQRQRQREARRARQQQREARRAQKQANFSGLYTPRQARKVAKAQTRTEYRPLERQISSEIRGSAKREGELGTAYNQLADDYTRQQQAAQKAFETATQATTERLGQQAQSVVQTGQGLAASQADFAKTIGAPPPSTPDPAEVAAAAERMRAELATFAAPTTNMEASYLASQAPLAGAARLGGLEAREREAGRRREKQSDLRALKRERGAATIDKLQTLREQDQNYSTQQQALGAKAGYNKALERQARLGLKGDKISARAQKQVASLYSAGRVRQAEAQENAARLYSEGKITAAQYQQRIAKIHAGAKKYAADRNVDVAKQQGRNAAKGVKGGYTVGEGVSLLRSALATRGFRTPGEAVDYLVNRGVKRSVAKRAAGRFWRAERGGG